MSIVLWLKILVMLRVRHGEKLTVNSPILVLMNRKKLVPMTRDFMWRRLYSNTKLTQKAPRICWVATSRQIYCMEYRKNGYLCTHHRRLYAENGQDLRGKIRLAKMRLTQSLERICNSRIKEWNTANQRVKPLEPPSMAVKQLRVAEPGQFYCII